MCMQLDWIGSDQYYGFTPTNALCTNIQTNMQSRSIQSNSVQQRRLQAVRKERRVGVSNGIKVWTNERDQKSQRGVSRHASKGGSEPRVSSSE